jgi:hypothetical protein
MLDAGFSRSFPKNNSGELKFSLFNLLDSELGVAHTNDAITITEPLPIHCGDILCFFYICTQSPA